MAFSSGLRCPECNRIAGGKEKSAHLTGEAADIVCPDSRTRFVLVSAAFAMGFTRIGVSRTFIHVDVSTTLPQSVFWLY
jgi:uncharacterized protein YcbK (DUF882 family)